MTRLEIVTDRAAMTITVGGNVFNRPILRRFGEMAFSIKAMCAGEPRGGEIGIKELHAYYCERLGPKFNRRFQAAQYHLWIDGKLMPETANLLRRSGKNWRQYSDELVARAHACLPEVQQAERDGLFHLIPAILAFKAPPHAIRQLVGKGAWKRIASNSKSRNRRILQVMDRYLPPNHDWGAAFVALLDFPSGVLPGVWMINQTQERLAAKLCPRKTPLSFTETLHIVRDTERMIGEINPSWSYARLNMEHERGVRGLTRKRFSKASFAAPWAFAKGVYSAELLTTQAEIAIEGDLQHHCVASYAGQAAAGHYAVVRITGKERATAGFRSSRDGWLLDQVYAACNAQVSAECRSFAMIAGTQLAEHRKVAA